MAFIRIYSAFIITIITITSLPYETESKWVEDIIKTDSDWIFITRFCFLSRIGNLNYSLEYPVDYGVQNLVFYYDVPGQWSSVYQQDLTCQQKVQVLQGRNQFPLTNTGSQCTIDKRKDQDWYVCYGNMDFSTARERWWFVVLTRCDAPANPKIKGMYLKYKLHMTNGDDLLHKEFSADEFYILVVDIVFFLIYVILLTVALICAAVLKKRQLFHTTYKMYLGALSIWTIHLLFMVIAWGYYGTTGWEIRPLEVTGRIFQTSSNIIFILMLILLAKGYTIVRGRLTTKAVLKITAFINLYIVAMVVMFIWEGVLFDPGLVLYYYESPPGYGMVTIILIGWLWFTKAAVFTLKHYSSKTVFYIAFYSFYTIWFWASPFVVLIAMFAMAKWTREKSVNGVQQFIGFLGHFIFLILTLPYKVDDNFPYHIRTTQIAAMDDGNDYTQTDMYTSSSVDSITGVGPDLDIFITSKSSRSDDDSNGNRMYTPLEPSSVGLRNGIPSSFQLATLPPVGNKPNEGEKRISSNGVNNFSHTTNQLSKNDGDAAGQGNNYLSPLQRALNGSDNRREEIILPPLRGTGLPPIIPSPPSVANEDGKEPTSHNINLFRVDN